MKIDMQSTFDVSKSHLEQCRDKTACRDVVTCHHPSPADEFLHGIETVGEVFGIGHRRHVRTHITATLCECRTSQALFAEGEVDMIEGGMVVVDDNR